MAMIQKQQRTQHGSMKIVRRLQNEIDGIFDMMGEFVLKVTNAKANEDELKSKENIVIQKLKVLQALCSSLDDEMHQQYILNVAYNHFVGRKNIILLVGRTTKIIAGWLEYMQCSLKRLKLPNLERCNQEDEKESIIDCKYFNVAKDIIKQEFPTLPIDFFDANGDMCFCESCHNGRNDNVIYKRGDPQKKYALPIGWCRLGLKTDVGFCKINKVWEKWHVAFHGTTKETVPLIFKGRLVLLKAGDIAVGGIKLGIKDGHIKKPFRRTNKYTKKKELFDPNQIYLSPSIKYSGCEVYAKWAEGIEHPNEMNKRVMIKAKFAFQVRVRPDSYSIGQETIGAEEKIDKHFSNNELEWYTKENLGIVVYGLLVRFDGIQ